MDSSSPSSEDILRKLESAIDKAEGSLRAGGQGDAQFALALRSLSLLRSFLHKMIERVADQDLAERAAVYSVITERCARFLEQPPDLVYPAVLRLCAESDINMTDGLPTPEPEIISSMEKVLLQVEVTYSPKGERAERTLVLLLHDARERQVREQKVMTEMPWENVPEDVRERFVRDGKRPVTFTLYRGGQ
jgi:hypothetical protein